MCPPLSCLLCEAQQAGISGALWGPCLGDALQIHGIALQMQIGLQYCYLSTEVKDGPNKPDLSECSRISLWPEGSVISDVASFSLWGSIDFSELGLSAQQVQGSLGPREVDTASCWPLLLRAESFPDNSNDRDGFSSVSKRLQRSSAFASSACSSSASISASGRVQTRTCTWEPLCFGCWCPPCAWYVAWQQRDGPYTAPKEGTKGKSWADLKKKIIKETKRNPQALMEQVGVQQYRYQQS